MILRFKTTRRDPTLLATRVKSPEDLALLARCDDAFEFAPKRGHEQILLHILITPLLLQLVQRVLMNVVMHTEKGCRKQAQCGELPVGPKVESERGGDEGAQREDANAADAPQC